MKSRVQALLVAIIAVTVLLMPGAAAAHCDTMDGPVVAAAMLALQKGDVTPALKWVREADEPQIRTVFDRTLKVRTLSPEAREVADHYFFETLVRVHRAGEGEPYTGIKPVGVKIDPVILRADRALETGSPDAVLKPTTLQIADGIRQKFSQVQEAAKHADEGVDAGRRYVAAYVEFIHYVETIHAASAGTSHGEHATPVARAHGREEP